VQAALIFDLVQRPRRRSRPSPEAHQAPVLGAGESRPATPARPAWPKAGRPGSSPVCHGWLEAAVSPNREEPWMKSARECMDIVNAYQELGSYRASARLCGTPHKTAKARYRAPSSKGARTPPGGGARNTDGVDELVTERVRATDGRISAKWLTADRSGRWLLVRTGTFGGSSRVPRQRGARSAASTARGYQTPGEYLEIG